MAAQANDVDLVRGALTAACQNPNAAPVAGATADRSSGQAPGPRAPLSLSVWHLPDTRKLRVTRLNQGRNGLVFADLYGGPRGDMALVRGVARADCRVLGGRVIDYRHVGGRHLPAAVVDLGPGMRQRGQTMEVNPPVPRGEGRRCLRVGLLDNGVNYLRPDIARRLAYDASGTLIGFDSWERDGRPFDYGYAPGHPDPRRALFNPRRHGTTVLGVMLDHAPESACVVPVRYAPFDATGSVDEAIAFLSGNDVRIVSVQSGRSRPWPEFRRAMEAHPHILFIVAAGNEGLDIARRPHYPASYPVANMLVVAGSDRTDTRLWQGSNYGGPADMIAFRAEDVPVRDFDGKPFIASGTSFSAPAVAGVAATLLARSPDMSAAELKSELLARAERSGRRDRQVAILPSAGAN